MIGAAALPSAPARLARGTVMLYAQQSIPDRALMFIRFNALLPDWAADARCLDNYGDSLLGVIRETGEVDTADVTHFRAKGWLRASNALLASDIDVIAASIAKAEKSDMTGWVGQVGADAASRESFAHQKSPKWRQMFRNETDLRLAFPELQPVVAKLTRIARQLLKRTDIRVMYDQTFTKPPSTEGTRETPWHQDLPYLPIDRRGFMTFWIPVEDVYAESGPMRFIPGSHRLGPLGKWDLIRTPRPLEEIFSPEDQILIERPETVLLCRGDLTIHDGLTLHSAGPNMTARPRRAWTVQIIPGDTLYSGGPFPLKRMSELGLAPFTPFDHPTFDAP